MQTKIIKEKMKSIKNIGKITKAMEMVSVSKMKKSISKRLASKVFADKSFELLENLHTHKELNHPYLEKGKGRKKLLVIIASNKGLCGGYNINVSKKVAKYKRQQGDIVVDTIVVGKQAERIALRNNLNIKGSFTEFSDYFTGQEVRALLLFIKNEYSNGEGEYLQISIIYTKFISSLSYKVKITPFIPLDIDRARKLLYLEKKTNTKKLALYTFEPNEQELLNRAVPAVLTTIIYQLLLESLASEHSARVMAMRNASDNAYEMLEDLKLNYNHARQAMITQEIAEIVGGSSAMS